MFEAYNNSTLEISRAGDNKIRLGMYISTCISSYQKQIYASSNHTLSASNYDSGFIYGFPRLQIPLIAII